MKTSELNPCPFCGSENLIISEFDNHAEEKIQYGVKCLNCGATPWQEEYNEENAVIDWNKRSK